MTTDIRWDDVVRYRGQNGLADAPDSPVPYHLGAKDGLFLVRRTMLGRGAIKLQYWPDHFDKLGGDQFLFEAPPIPGTLMSQVVDFFRRTYERLHAEAAVLLTLNELNATTYNDRFAPLVAGDASRYRFCELLAKRADITDCAPGTFTLLTVVGVATFNT